MMIYEHSMGDGLASPGPGSPPGMTASKSSKTSSLNSFGSDDLSTTDVSHFEEIGLDDDDLVSHPRPSPDRQFRSPHLPYNPKFSASDLRVTSLKPASNSTPRLQYSRDFSWPRAHRDLTALPKSRPSFPGLQTPAHSANVRSASLGVPPEPRPRRSLGNCSPTVLSFRRQRSPSPNNFFLTPPDTGLHLKPRRSSWQPSHDNRKTNLQLELDCDEDDGDDIPDGLVLDNVPISPRPTHERIIKSQPCSKATSPERLPPKERVRSVGNGTPPVALARGSLRSPTWKSDTAVPTLKSVPSSPIQARAKSWTAALADLNAEAKALTEKLEEHASEVENLKTQQRSSTGSIPNARRASHDGSAKPRVKSALAELPALRRTNIMIDPLPISKEKEAVLSRTRPSWLPPKDPAEERRHLREYQKIVAASAEAERRRDAVRRAQCENRDVAADGQMRLWEHEVLPRWNVAVAERRTRELWWSGVAPRSRGRVWSKALGNGLGLTEASYKAALGRAHETEARSKGRLGGSPEDQRQSAWFAAIRKDAEERTWVHLRIFQAGGPLHQSLVDVLSAYAMYRSDIGYVSGCNTIAALLLLNLPSPAAAFIALANVLNRPLPMSFHVSDAGAKASAYNLVLQTLATRAPRLHQHLVELADHEPDAYLNNVFTTMFTAHLALDAAARIWDVYVFEGDALLIRAAAALMLEHEASLLATRSMDEVLSIVNGHPITDAASHSPTASQQPRPGVTRGASDEDRWMKAVREVGKA